MGLYGYKNYIDIIPSMFGIVIFIWFVYYFYSPNEKNTSPSFRRVSSGLIIW
jgi:hypothetical protein